MAKPGACASGGLGRLPGGAALVRALAHGYRARKPYPGIFLASITNTALLPTTRLGHFDESLRLYDRRAFCLLAKGSGPGANEAYCLYGIGVKLLRAGRPDAAAREFLERVARDSHGGARWARDAWPHCGRWRPSTPNQGRVDDAIASDREALGLAVAPSAIERIRIQTGGPHRGPPGRLVEAKEQAR